MKPKPTIQTPSKLADAMAWICVAILVLLPFHALFVTWLGGIFHQPEAFKVWKELLILLLIPGSIVLLIRRPTIRKNFVHSTLVIAIIGYLLLTLLRGWYSYSAGNVTTEALAYGLLANMRYLGFFLVVFIIAQASHVLQDHWPAMIIGPATIVVIFGLLQQFVLSPDFLTHFNYGPDTISPFQTVDAKSGWLRAQSTLKGPNPLGAYLTIVITTIVALFYKAKSQRFVLGFLGVLTASLLFFTYSRSAFLGGLVSIFAWLLLGITKRRYLMIAVIGICTTVLVLFGTIFILRNNDFVQNAIFHTDENSTSNSSTNQVRGEALKNGIRNIKAAPQGRGVGTAGPASWHNDEPVRIAENYFIQIGEEVGVLGMLLFLMICGIIAVRLFFLRAQVLPRILLASFLGIMVINMISHAWMDDTLSLLWWGLAGIALAPAMVTAATPAIIKGKHHENQTKTKKTTR